MDSTYMNMMSDNSSDAFDGSAEPIVYMSENRIPVMMEFSSTIIYIIFAALILALLFILPGVRKTKLASLLSLFTQITVCASILLALQQTSWLIGQVQISNLPYSSLTTDTFTGHLDVYVGLSSLNVSLVGSLSDDMRKKVDYNERFQWSEPEKMLKEHQDALRKGLPYPILTVTDFFSQDSDGFNWARQLRQAGYYTSLAIYLSLASWFVTVIIMCALPTYLPHMMQITGILLLASAWIYTLMIQSPKLYTFQLGSNQVKFTFGYTALLTFLAGVLSIISGVILLVMQMNNPFKQFTIMDSEHFLKDQKILYDANLFSSTMDKKPVKLYKKDQKKPNEIEQNTTPAQPGSVVIPMADIEQLFRQRQSA